MNLPQPKNEDEFELIDRNDASFRDAIRFLFKNELPSITEIQAFENGSCPTFSIDGKYVAKFFHDMHMNEFENEASTLKFLSSSKFKVPQLVSGKKINGWSALLMTQLSGVPLVDIWEDLSIDKKMDISNIMGQQIHLLHSVGTPDQMAENKWKSFLCEQKKLVMKDIKA